jgi:hypothetical protein
MQSTSETFDTLKRVNASLHKLNQSLMGDYAAALASNSKQRDINDGLMVEMSKYYLENESLRAQIRQYNEQLLSDVELAKAQCAGNWEALKVANSEVDKLALTCAELRERNQQLEQMLAAISVQCEKEHQYKDMEIARLQELNISAAKKYHKLASKHDAVCNKRDIELALLVSIIRGEI